MARKHCAARKPKATGLENVELDLGPENSPTPQPPADGEVDKKVVSTAKSDPSKPENSMTTK